MALFSIHVYIVTSLVTHQTIFSPLTPGCIRVCIIVLFFLPNQESRDYIHTHIFSLLSLSLLLLFYADEGWFVVNTWIISQFLSRMTFFFFLVGNALFFTFSFVKLILLLLSIFVKWLCILSVR